jgi:hypothetical protein
MWRWTGASGPGAHAAMVRGAKDASSPARKALVARSEREGWDDDEEEEEEEGAREEAARGAPPGWPWMLRSDDAICVAEETLSNCAPVLSQVQLHLP